MKPRKSSVDGFVTRQPNRRMLGDHAVNGRQTDIGHTNQKSLPAHEMYTGRTDAPRRVMAADEKNLNSENLSSSIAESLGGIDEEQQHAKKSKQKKHQKRRWFKTASLIVGLLVILGLLFMGYKTWGTLNRVFNGNPLSLLQQQELKKDEFGRSNVLVLGSTDDMAGRDGATLTDSMMVISVDQKEKNAYIFSIPRDLYVKYDRACLPGYEGKINAYNQCVSEGEGKEAEMARMDGTRALVGNIFNMDIQYAVHVNTTVIRDSVNAVGGVTVNVDSSDPRGVLDSTFDDLCSSEPGLCKNGHYLEFANGPNEMNGNQAMAFSQARGMGALTYGLGESNFDREKNQQLVLLALKDKATSAGVLTDVMKVMGLMDAMGSNLRTNIDTKEIQTIMKLAADMPESSIHRLNFYDEENRLMTTGQASGQSIVQPSAGLFNYSAIHAYLKRTIFATPLSREAAKVVVVNASGETGAAGRETERLADLGLDMQEPSNSPEDIKGDYTIYQLSPSDDKPLTRQKLEELYGSLTSGRPSFAVDDGVDFVVILGTIGGTE